MWWPNQGPLTPSLGPMVLRGPWGVRGEGSHLPAPSESGRDEPVAQGLYFVTFCLHPKKMNLEWRAPRIHCADEEARARGGQEVLEILLQDPTCGHWQSWDSHPGLGSCRGRAFGDGAWTSLGVAHSPGSGKPLQTVRATLCFPNPRPPHLSICVPISPLAACEIAADLGLCDVCRGSATWPWDAGCTRPSHWQISSAASKPSAPPGCPGEQEQPGQAS